MFNMRLLGYGRCHSNHYHDWHIGYVTGCIHPSFVQIGLSIGRRVLAFPPFSNMAAVCHVELEFCHSGQPWSSLRGSITLLKFRVDPIFAVGDIAILWFCQFGWKMLNHATFMGFCEVCTPYNCGSSSVPQKTHPWVRTRHLSHKPSQEAQLLQRDRATLRVIEYLAKSLKVTQGHSKWHCWVGRVKVPITFYIETMSASRTVSEIFSVKNGVTWKPGLGVVQGHWK